MIRSRSLPRTEQGKRDPSIDVARGIAMILVVGGHSWLPFWCSHDFVYLFHMSLFMTISGYCFRERHMESRKAVGGYILQRLKTLYLPYAIGNAVFILLNNVFLRLQIYCGNNDLAEQIQTGVGMDPWLSPGEMARQVLSCFLFIGYSPRMGGATWFLRALFFISILYAVIGYFLLNLLQRNHPGKGESASAGWNREDAKGGQKISWRNRTGVSVQYEMGCDETEDRGKGVGNGVQVCDWQMIIALVLLALWAADQVRPFLRIGSVAQICQYYFAYVLGDWCRQHRVMERAGTFRHPMAFWGTAAAGGYLLLQLCGALKNMVINFLSPQAVGTGLSNGSTASVGMAGTVELWLTVLFLQAVTAWLGWWMVYGVSRLVCHFIPFCEKVLVRCGQGTLETLLLHFLCFKAVTELYILVHRMPQFYLGATPILPGIHAGWGCLYILAGIGIPTEIHFLRKKIRGEDRRQNR